MWAFSYESVSRIRNFSNCHDSTLLTHGRGWQFFLWQMSFHECIIWWSSPCFNKGTHLTPIQWIYCEAHKCEWATYQTEYLGFMLSTQGIWPVSMENIQHLCVRKELHSFIRLINYYQDMWPRRAHILQSLPDMTGSKSIFRWGPDQLKHSWQKTCYREALWCLHRLCLPFICTFIATRNSIFLLHIDIEPFVMGFQQLAGLMHPMLILLITRDAPG